MRPSPLGASRALARPGRPLSLLLPALLVLMLTARPGVRAQATIDNNFGELYKVGPETEECLNDAGADCSGSTGAELNSCLCRRDRFALESARCIARVSPDDLDGVYFRMRSNCLETGGFTLVVDQDEWDSAAEAATATTSSTSTSSPTSTSAGTSTTPTATRADDDDDTTSTAGPTSGTGLGTTAATSTPSAAAAAGGLDTGGKIGVGVAVAVGAILLAAGVFIWLKWRKRQREGPRYADRDAHIMEASDMVRTYPPSQAGAGGAMGAGMYRKPPVGTASTSTSPADQPSPDLRGGSGGGGGGGHWMPGAHPYHPHQQHYAYPDHPSIAELGDGSDVTSHALSARDSARYSELPGGQSPLYPPPSSPSPVSPGPNTSPPLLGPHNGHDPRRGGH